MVSRKEQYGLTDLEWETALLIANGLTEKEIAPKLKVSNYKLQKTIKSLISKTGAVNKITSIYLLFKP